MALAPKIFAARPSSTVLNISLLDVFAGSLLGSIAFCRQGLEYQCKYCKPSWVSMALERRIRSSNNPNGRCSVNQLTVERMGVQLESNRVVKLWALWGFRPGWDPPDVVVPCLDSVSFSS